MSKHQDEYKKAMDSIHVTAEWEDDMIRKLMNAETKTPRLAPRAGLIAAAAVACLTIGAGAAEAATGVVSDLFAPLLGTAHTEIIDSIGYPVGVSDSSGGVTIQADAIIGDVNNVCVLFTLTKDDGSAWDIDLDSRSLMFEDSDLEMGLVGAHGGSWFFDEDPGDNVIQFVEQRTVDEGIQMGSARATMKNLLVWDFETQETKMLAEGKWKLRFDLAFEDTARHFQGGQKIEFLEAPAIVREITLSPISFRVEVQQDRTDSDFPGDSGVEHLAALSVVLRLKDGTEMDLSLGGGSVTPGDSQTVFVRSGIFNEIVPTDELESIVVCGTEIALQE